MHLIVTLDDQPIDAELDTAWSALLQTLEPAWAIQPGPDSLSTPAEHVRARLFLGRPTEPGEDGRLPWVAWRRGEPGAWGRLTPCHGLVGSDRITGLPVSALNLTQDESRALFEAVEPLYRTEGVALHWQGPLEWHLGHDSLRGLPCASLDRMVGDSLQRWQGRTPLAAARLLRRLQNESQMVLHDHPVNREREARRALTVNSLWLSEAGAGDQVAGAPALAEWPERLASLPDPIAARSVSGLRAMLASAPESTTLVLCGPAGAQAFRLRSGRGAHEAHPAAASPERSPGSPAWRSFWRSARSSGWWPHRWFHAPRSASAPPGLRLSEWATRLHDAPGPETKA